MRPTVSASLAGRARELVRLQSALAEARQGRGSFVMFEGAEGAGKSRLAHDIVREATELGLVPIVGQCRPSTFHVAYAPLAEAFRAPFEMACPHPAPELLPFWPALRWFFDPTREVPEPAEAATLGIREGLLTLAALAGASNGAIVVIDDLHLADAETLAVLEAAATHAADSSVAWVVMAQSGDTAVSHWAARLVTDDVIERFELAPLTDYEVEEWLTEQLGKLPSDELVEAVHVWSDGLPAYIDELLRALMAADGWTASEPIDAYVPVDLEEGVHVRVDALSDRARMALGAAAICGEHFDPSLVAGAVHLSRRAIAEALTAAVDAGLLTADARGLRFRHGLVREAVLTAFPDAELQKLAQSILEAIVESHPGLPGDWCGVAADVAVLAGDRRRAASLLIELGQRAVMACAYESAISAYDGAASLGGPATPTHVDALECWIEALVFAGEPDQAVAVSEQLRGALDECDAPDSRRAEAMLVMARAAWANAAEASVVESQLAAARDLASPDDFAFLARIERQQATVAFAMGRLDDGFEAANAARTHAERAGLAGIVCESLTVTGWWSRADDVEGAKASFTRARAIAEQRHLPAWAVRARYELAVVAQLDQGRFDQLAETRKVALESGALITLVSIDLRTAALHLARFEPDAALEKAVEAQRMAERFELPMQVAAALVTRAEGHALRREPDEMATCIRAGLAGGGDNPDLMASAYGEARAIHALLEEDHEVAMSEFDAAMAIVRELPFVAPFGFRGLCVLLQAAEGDDDAREELRESGATLFRPNAAYLALSDAIALGRQGRAAEARELARRAEADLARYGGYCHLAMRLTAEPALADGWGNPAVWLRHAAIFFEGTGHSRVVDACHGLMVDAGIAPPERGPVEVVVGADLRAAGVTKREVEVLDLVAEGLSNAEIGRRLELSPRTIEKHVASLQAKTGHGNRAQLQAFAADRLARQSG